MKLLVIPLLLGTAFGAETGAVAERTPAEQAQQQTQRLTQFFHFSATQQSDVLGILTAADTETRVLRQEIQPLREKLFAAIKANDQEGINATLQQLAPLDTRVKTVWAVAAAQIYTKVLTPEQQEQVMDQVAPLFEFGVGVIPTS